MGFFLIAPWIQLGGICIPLLGCVALFRKEQTKVSMSLLLTNVGCLFINCIYMLMLGAAMACVVMTGSPYAPVVAPAPQEIESPMIRIFSPVWGFSLRWAVSVREYP